MKHLETVAPRVTCPFLSADSRIEQFCSYVKTTEEAAMLSPDRRRHEGY
jgi:hypothetical protein